MPHEAKGCSESAVNQTFDKPGEPLFQGQSRSVPRASTVSGFWVSYEGCFLYEGHHIVYRCLSYIYVYLYMVVFCRSQFDTSTSQ